MAIGNILVNKNTFKITDKNITLISKEENKESAVDQETANQVIIIIVRSVLVFIGGANQSNIIVKYQLSELIN